MEFTLVYAQSRTTLSPELWWIGANFRGWIFRSAIAQPIFLWTLRVVNLFFTSQNFSLHHPRKRSALLWFFTDGRVVFISCFESPWMLFYSELSDSGFQFASDEGKKKNQACRNEKTAVPMNSFKIRQNKYSDRFSTVVVLCELRKKLKSFRTEQVSRGISGLLSHPPNSWPL